MGATQMVLTGVGLQTGSSPTPGFNITFLDVASTSATDYQLWYDDGVLVVWENGEIQYSNQTGAAVDTNNISITDQYGNSTTPAGNAGLPVYITGGGNGQPILANAITVTAAAALTSTGTTPTPIIKTAPDDGTNLTGRQKYVAIRQALDMLTGIQCLVIYAPDAVFDQPNVAYYVSGTPTTVVNNPATNPNALDWMLVTTDSWGDNLYQWASETVNYSSASPKVGANTVAAYGGTTYAPTGFLTATITPSTLTTPSVATLSAGASGDHLSGLLTVQQGTGTPVTTVIPANTTIANAVIAINAAITTAAITPTITATQGIGYYSNQIILTGVEDPVTAGSRTLVVASDVLDTRAVISGFASASARQEAGFMEVNYGVLGVFAADLSEIGPLVTTVVGFSSPASASLLNTRRWVGYLPTYGTSGQAIVDGAGLLGTPLTVGCTSTKLNSLCSDYVNGFRAPGIYQTVDGSYDGEIVIDGNGNPVDAGAHMHLFADWSFLTNNWAVNYINNGAGLVTGLMSSLDASTGLTNTQVSAAQIWQPTPPQLDALTEAKISVLRYKGINVQPALLHDLTAATNASDYTNMVRVRCMGMVIKTLLTRANSYIGKSSLDGLTLVSMITQLQQDLANLTKRGYCNHGQVSVSSTAAQQKIGHATMHLTANPADELIQLTANVGIGQ
jgi:hypothetical protein